MKATVVVSCYKQERYIEECLDSILEQEVDFDFDVLVSDDASPDSTPDILMSYAEKHPDKIRLVLRSQNVGAARNYIDAHNMAEGEVVFHFDGDDVMLPGKLQKQYNVFRKNPDVNLVFHRARYFSDDGSYVAETGYPCHLKNNGMFFEVEDLALWGSITVHSAYAYRRGSRKTRNLNREFMEWFFAMDSLASGGRAVYLDEILVKYRCNPNGGAYLASKAGRIKSYNIYFRDVEYYYEKLGHLRGELYANFLFTALAMARAGCGFSGYALRFLVKNVFYLKVGKLGGVFKVRKSVAPEERIR